jgi:Sec-independent protein translocase protein TatA
MEFLGVGPFELLLILILALIILGPSDMVKTGRTIGRYLRNLVKSPTWRAVQQTSQNLRYLPTLLMREAALDEEVEKLKQIGQDVSQLGNISQEVSQSLRQTTQEINTSLNDIKPPSATVSPEVTLPPDVPLPPSPTTPSSSNDISAWTTPPPAVGAGSILPPRTIPPIETTPAVILPGPPPPGADPAEDLPQAAQAEPPVSWPAAGTPELRRPVPVNSIEKPVAAAPTPQPEYPAPVEPAGEGNAEARQESPVPATQETHPIPENPESSS